MACLRRQGLEVVELNPGAVKEAAPTKRVRTWLSAPIQHRVRVRQRVTAGEATHHPAHSRNKNRRPPSVHIQRRPHPELTNRMVVMGGQIGCHTICRSVLSLGWVAFGGRSAGWHRC
jgi:hypothetical protein